MTLTASERDKVVRLYGEHVGVREIAGRMSLRITDVQAAVEHLPKARVKAPATPAVMPPVKAVPVDDRLEHLLAEGDRSPRPGTRRLAGRLRTQLGTLRDRLAQEERAAELDAGVALAAEALRLAQEARRAAKTNTSNSRSTDARP